VYTVVAKNDNYILHTHFIQFIIPRPCATFPLVGVCVPASKITRDRRILACLASLDAENFYLGILKTRAHHWLIKEQY